VSALAPYALAGKSSTQVQVEYQGIRSQAVSLPVVASLPGIFSRDSTGKGQGAILNQDGVTSNSPSAPAPRGSVVSLFITGEGAADSQLIDGQLAIGQSWKPVLPVKVMIGGVEAGLQYAGSAPGSVAGFLQVNAAIPQDAPTGDAVEVKITVGDAASPPVTMAIR
jgi:uncharacterized protein (TIGR03437 family)